MWKELNNNNNVGRKSKYRAIALNSVNLFLDILRSEEDTGDFVKYLVLRLFVIERVLTTTSFCFEDNDYKNLTKLVNILKQRLHVTFQKENLAL